MDIMSKVPKSDRDNARIDRDRVVNPPLSEPGMADFDWGGDSDTGFSKPPVTTGPFGSTSPDFSGGSFNPPVGPSTGTWGTSLGNTLPGAGIPSLFGVPPMAAQPPKATAEDNFFKTLALVSKGFLTFSIDFIKSFKTLDAFVRMRTGFVAFVVSCSVTVAGLILSVFGLGIRFGFPLLTGGLVAVSLSVVIFMFSYEKVATETPPNSLLPPDTLPMDMANMPLDTFSASEQSEWDMFSDDDDDDDYPQADLAPKIDFSAFEVVSQEAVESSMTATLDSLNSNMGMVTRQYLYDNIINCLVGGNQNFDRVRVIGENTSEFDAWDSIIQNSAGIFKPKGTDLDSVYLISAKEKLFYFQLEINRTNWLKNTDAFVQEIVNICRFNEDTGATDQSIYGVGNTVGNKVYVKIMKGETALVTVKDVYKNVSAEVKNPNNYMPVVLGLDAEGGVVWKDFKDINSILVTGMPRSGKTWFVESIIAQMTFYLKPSELEFYMLDPKDSISDFRFMEVPHIRKFVSTDEGILKELRNIVKIEGPRRKKLIGDAGFVNIWDFKKRNPDVRLPLLYVVIDEVITLAERMDKEVKDEFQGLLLELVSQLPALGIRIFMIPHIVKDNILKKSITDLIPCRVSVRGDAEHIERSIGAKNFKHKLTHQGDMAVRFNNDEPLFVHSAVITPSNEANQDLFDFLLKFWLKLEPDSYEGSLHHKRHAGGNSASSSLPRDSRVTHLSSSAENSASDRAKLSPQDLTELLGRANDDSADEVNLFD